MFNPLAIKAYLLVSFVGVIALQVSLTNVAANMPSVTNIDALYRFSSSAFLNTEFVVQLLSVGTLVAIFLLLKDVVKTYSISTPATV